MAISANYPTGDVKATLNYYSPPADNSVPFNLIDPPEGVEPRNYGDSFHETLIRDLRGHESEFTLDRDSFQVFQDVPPSAEVDFVDDASIEKNYYPEIKKILLDNIPGSNQVYIFDHTVRRAGPKAKRGPVNRAHIDQTPKAVAKRVRRYFPEEEAEKLLRGRYRLVNVWRPLNKKPVEASPLAFASSASVSSKDVITVEHRYSDGYNGETAAINYSPEQQWYYLSGMTGSERLFLQCFDSETLNRVPHSAFTDPRTKVDAEGRESIEVRTLVFGP